MGASVNLTQAKEIVRKVMHLKKNGINIPLMLWGHHGIGKTSIVRQVGEECKYNVVTLNLANQTPEDLLGQIDGQGGYHKPKWMVVDGTPTIYFLDETNRAPKYVLQCMFNFILEGRIHTHTIGPDDIVLAACNPPSEKYEIVDFEDDAFLSRFCHLEVHPDRSEFLAWIHGKGVKNSVVQVTLSNSRTLYQEKSFTLPYAGSSDNRNLERVAYLFDNMSESEVRSIGGHMISGLVGFDAMAVIMTTWEKTKFISFEDSVLKAKDFEFPNDGMDVINTLNVGAVNYLKAKVANNKLKLSVHDRERFWEYINYIPKDAQVALIKEIQQQVSDTFLDNYEKDQFTYILKLFQSGSKKKS